jgi:hypothetical protein
VPVRRPPLPTAVALLAALAALAALPAAALAGTVYCIGDADGSCQTTPAGATPGLQLRAAMAATLGSSGSDTIRLGAGLYEAAPVPGGSVFATTDPGLRIIGAGAATHLRATSASASNTILNPGPGGQVTGVRVTPFTAANASGIMLNNGTATDVMVTGPGGSNSLTGLTSSGAMTTVRDATVTGVQTALTTTGSLTVVVDSELTGLWHGIIATGPTSVTDSAITTTGGSSGDSALWALANTDVFDSVVRATGAGSGAPVAAQCGNATGTQVNLSNATVLGTYPASVSAWCPAAGQSAGLSVADSILGGRLMRDGATGAANIAVTRSIIGAGGLFTDTGQGTTITDSTVQTGVDPQFVSATDLRLRAGSPAIDRGAAAPTGRYDRDSLPRTADGDGDGVLRRDLGAFERQSAPLGVPAGNLLAMPGAEADGAGTVYTSSPDLPPPWVREAGHFTFSRYGSDLYFPGAGIGQALGAGASYFWGGTASPLSQASQTVDLSASAAAIDTGRGTVRLSGLLGGYGTEEDTARVQAQFRDGAGHDLGTPLAIGPVLRDERDRYTTLVPRSAGGAVPSGARSVKVTMIAERSGTDLDNDASFDDLGLALDLPTMPGDPGPGPGPGTPPGPGAPPPPPGNPIKNVIAYRGATLPAGTLKLDRHRKAVVRVSCPKATTVGRCRGTLTLTTTQRVHRRTVTVRLATAKVDVAAGAVARVRLTILRARWSLIPRHGTAKAKLTITSHDDRGTSKTTTKTIRVARATAR